MLGWQKMRLVAAVLGVVMIELVPAPATAGMSDVDDPVGSDYDGDGIDDLAVGAVSNSVRGYVQTGTVSVLYGSPRV